MREAAGDGVTAMFYRMRIALFFFGGGSYLHSSTVVSVVDAVDDG